MKFSGFSEWVQDESVFSVVGGAFHKIAHAARTAAWAARHPAQVPPEIGHAIADEWHDLVSNYGYTEASIIMASLVISLGPGLAIPGSLVLFWVTLGVCRMFNTVIGKKKPAEEPQHLSQEQVEKEAERIKDYLIKVAEKAKDTAR